MRSEVNLSLPKELVFCAGFRAKEKRERAVGIARRSSARLARGPRSDPETLTASPNDVQRVVAFLSEWAAPSTGEQWVPVERLREMVETLRSLTREQPWLNNFPYHVDRFPLYTAELLL